MVDCVWLGGWLCLIAWLIVSDWMVDCKGWLCLIGWLIVSDWIADCVWLDSWLRMIGLGLILGIWFVIFRIAHSQCVEQDLVNKKTQNYEPFWDCIASDHINPICWEQKKGVQTYRDVLGFHNCRKDCSVWDAIFLLRAGPTWPGGGEGVLICCLP